MGRRGGKERRGTTGYMERRKDKDTDWREQGERHGRRKDGIRKTRGGWRENDAERKNERGNEEDEENRKEEERHGKVKGSKGGKIKGKKNCMKIVIENKKRRSTRTELKVETGNERREVNEAKSLFLCCKPQPLTPSHSSRLLHFNSPLSLPIYLMYVH